MDSETRPASRGSKKAKTVSRTTPTKKGPAAGSPKPAKKSAAKPAKKAPEQSAAARKPATARTAVTAVPAGVVVAPAARPVAESHHRAVSADERRRMIAETAYYRATRRGGAPGDPTRDWLEAEAEIDARLMAGRDLD